MMTVENTLPHGLKASVPGSAYKTEYDENLTLLDKNRIQTGLLSARPAAGTAERFYYASDTGAMYYDDGANWLNVSAMVSHTHAEADVTNLVTDLAAKAAKGANSDITSLAGLTTALSILQGGTGAATAQAAIDLLTAVAAATVGQVLAKSAGGNAVFETPAAGGGTDILIYQEQGVAGGNSGAFTSGAWRTRNLTNEVTDSGGHGSLAANQITLSAGTYRVSAWGAAFVVRGHKLRLQNITDGTTEIVGASMEASSADASAFYALLEGKFTIAGAKVFELQHICELTRGTNGFGPSFNFSVIEIYSSITFERE